MSSTVVATRPTSEKTDDSDLLVAVRRGDDRAFERLYERYQGQICGFVRGRVRDHGLAEDITQEVFFSALRSLRESDREIVFKPWIYTIATNACHDVHRRSGRTDEVSLDAEDGMGAGEQQRLSDWRLTPDAVLDTKQRMDDLCGAFGTLSQTHHDILVMRELEGRSYREIGERLGMSRASVESALFRARRRLHEEHAEIESGQRCVRVQGIIANAGSAAVGVKDRRRLAQHISQCQPCRRHALVAGMDLTAPKRSVVSRIAGFLPLPAFLKRRWDDDGGLLSTHAASSPVTQWSAHVASSVDPGTVGGWSKAVVGAAAVALGSFGAGSAIEQRDLTPSLLERAPMVKELQGVDAGAVLSGARSAAAGRDGKAELGGAGSSSSAVGTGGSAVGSGERKRRSRRSSSASSGGAWSRTADSAGTGEEPSAERLSMPSRRPAPNLSDVTGKLGLTGGAGSGQGSGGGSQGAGDEPAAVGPARRVVEGVLGVVGGSGSGGGGAGGGAPAQQESGGATGGGGGGGTVTGAGAGTVTGAAGTASGATTVAAPGVVNQVVSGVNTVTSIPPTG